MAIPRGAEKLGWGCKASEDTRVEGISAGWSLCQGQGQAHLGDVWGHSAVAQPW